MSDEAPPKRESYTGWIAGVVVLLLLAAAVPIALKVFGPDEVLLDLQGDLGGQIVWSFQSGQTTQTGVTNLPVKLVFHARQFEFTALRTNYAGPLRCKAVIDGREEWGSLSTEHTSVRFLWCITTTNGVQWGFPSTP